MALTLEARRLSQADRLGDFGSGHDGLDEFFRRYAKQHQARQISATFVAFAAETIVGFATVAPTTIPAEHLQGHVKHLPRFPAPALLLARMATDARFHKQGVGVFLLREVVFAQALALADGFGCVGIYVDPKRDAVGFYAKHNFVPLSVQAGIQTAPPPMFLPLGTIPRAIDGA